MEIMYWKKIEGSIIRCERFFFFFSSRRRHTRFDCDWSSDVCSSDLFLILNGRRQPLNFEAWDRMAQNPSHVGHALYCVASEGYFRTVGIPLIRGRIFKIGRASCRERV